MAPMMQMNTNLMTTLPMPMWNPMTYPMLRGVYMSINTYHPSTCGYTCSTQYINIDCDTHKKELYLEAVMDEVAHQFHHH
jgi:hypothetical protein